MALNDRSVWEWVPNMAYRPRLSRVLFCVILVWMCAWILNVERISKTSFADRGSNEYILSPSRAFQRGLTFEGPVLPWDLYWMLVQSAVPRNATYEAADIPHVSSGVSCGSCDIDKYAFPIGKPPTLLNAPGWFFMSRFSAQSSPKKEVGERKRCYGCLHELVTVKESVFPENDINFVLRDGHTAAGAFFVSGPNVPTGKAVVKYHCLNKEGFLRDEVCSKAAIRCIQNETAVRKVARECGLEDVLPKAWVGPVDGMNGTEHLRTMGYWSEVAEGLSFRSIWDHGTRKMAVESINKVNSTQVITATLLDALTGQRDRNPNNAFISSSGRLTLIDNENVFGVHCWQKHFGFRCPTRLETMFIPGPAHGPVVDSLKWESTETVGENIVRRSPRRAHTIVRLDYRCHAPNGKIGTDFPPKMAACLSRFGRMSVSRVEREVFPGRDAHLARELIGRAKDLSRLGFEGAVKKWYARVNGPMDWGKPCCKVQLMKSTAKYTCGLKDV